MCNLCQLGKFNVVLAILCYAMLCHVILISAMVALQSKLRNQDLPRKTLGLHLLRSLNCRRKTFLSSSAALVAVSQHYSDC